MNSEEIRNTPGNDLNQAQEEVEQQRLQLESALRHLEDKLQATAERVMNTVEKAIYTVETPQRVAREHPFANAAIFAVAGLVIGSVISDRFNSDDEFSRNPELKTG